MSFSASQPKDPQNTPEDKGLSPEQDAMRRAASGWLARGFSVIPVDLVKRPTIPSWRPYQQLLPTHEQLNIWIANPQLAGLALICGMVSGDLVVLDFDEPRAYLDFVVKHLDLADTYTVQTGRGFHVYLYCDDLPLSQDLGWCEVKSSGRYVVAPPSLHASGKRYQVAVRQPIKRVANLDAALNLPLRLGQGSGDAEMGGEQLEALPTRSALLAGTPQGGTGNANSALSAAIADVLRNRGWRERGDWLNGQCVNPAHDDAHPSAGFCEGTGVYHCFACGAHQLKEAAAWLDLDSRDGWQYVPDVERKPAGEPAAHPNLALKYPDKRAMPLLILLDAWLTANNSLRPSIDEFLRWAWYQGWDYSEGRLRYLLRHYGALMHVVIEGDTLLLPSLEELATRFVGRRGPGPAYTLPPAIDPVTRGGAAQMRSWLFFADREGQPTPARYAARRLGYQAHQSPLNHAQNDAVEIIKGRRLLLSEEEAADADVGGRFCLWRATLADGTRKHFEPDPNTKTSVPVAALAWIGERLARLAMIIIEADCYFVQTVAQMSQIRQNPMQYKAWDRMLVRLKVGLRWSGVGTVELARLSGLDLVGLSQLALPVNRGES